MKQRIVAILLALFLGGYGAHWFYLNNNNLGLKYLIWTTIGAVTSWLLIGLIPLMIIGVMALVDFIKFCMMSDDEFNNLYN